MVAAAVVEVVVVVKKAAAEQTVDTVELVGLLVVEIAV